MNLRHPILLVCVCLYIHTCIYIHMYIWYLFGVEVHLSSQYVRVSSPYSLQHFCASMQHALILFFLNFNLVRAQTYIKRHHPSFQGEFVAYIYIYASKVPWNFFFFYFHLVRAQTYIKRHHPSFQGEFVV